MSAELATVGSLFRFAVDLENTAHQYYATLLQLDSLEKLKAPFSTLQKAHFKRARTLRRLQQDQLSELILEPISDMNAATYSVELSTGSDLSATDALTQARSLEDAICRFFSDCIAKASSAVGSSVVRNFKKFAGPDHLSMLDKL